jgi:hypothetical protein
MIKLPDLKTKRIRTIHFGQKGMDDYTQTGDMEQKRLYRARHRHTDYMNPMKPAFYSWHLLWGRYTDLKKNYDLVMKTFFD